MTAVMAIRAWGVRDQWLKPERGSGSNTMVRRKNREERASRERERRGSGARIDRERVLSGRSFPNNASLRC